MNNVWFIALFETIAVFLALAGTVTRVFGAGKRSRSFQVLILVISLAAAAVPFNGLNGSQYFLTVTGHLSFTSMCLLAAFILHSFSGIVFWKPGEKPSVLIAAAVCGVLLYLAAFGVISFDIYQLGYSSLSLIVLLAACTAAASALRFNIALAILLSAAAAFQLHLLRSDNIWDYLVDPLLVIYAAASLAIWIFRGVMSHHSAGKSASETR